MIQRKRLLGLIDKAIGREERLVCTYSSHCLLFAELLASEPATLEHVRRILLKLRDESREHKSTLEKLRKTIEESPDRHAY